MEERRGNGKSLYQGGLLKYEEGERREEEKGPLSNDAKPQRNGNLKVIKIYE